MALERYPPPLRRVVLLLWGAAFVWLVFVYGPTQFMEINADLGWPVWRSGPILRNFLPISGKHPQQVYF